MTINNSANKVIVAGNGVQTVFNFSFIAVNKANLSVILTDASGNQTTLAPANYTAALNAAPPGQIWGIGGTVTYPLVGSPIPMGSTLTIVRNLTLTQLVSLSNQGNVFPSAVESGLDILEMQLQQVSELFQRAIVAPVVDPSAPLPLPPAAQRANLALVFDGLGNPIAGTAPASGVISSAMQPVVNAASLAAGRTAFGLGTMATEGIGTGLQDDGAGNARVNTPVTPVASNQAIHAANATAAYAATGALTFTFDRANTLFNGFSIKVYALTAAITFAIDSHDLFFGQSSGASLIIPKGSVATITTDGANSGTFYADVTGVTPVINVQVFTSSGTYTPSAGLVYAVVECQAGGGAGGGTASTAITISGGGGGGGGYARRALSAAQIGTSQAVTVGAGGASVISAPGGAGTLSSFGALCSANPGSGGGVANPNAGAPGGGGAGGTGDILLPGSDGAIGFFSSILTVAGLGGQGGHSRLGAGAPATATSGAGSLTGRSGVNYGGGGGGAFTLNSVGLGGGPGAPGIVIVTEYLAFAA